MGEVSERNIYLLMTLAALFWAGAFVGGKVGMEEFTPVTLTFFRFLVATLILFPLMLHKEGSVKRVGRKDFLVLAFLGLTGMFGYHILFFTSLQFTTAINTSLISASCPIITTILAGLLVNEILGKRRWAAVLMAFAGVLLTISGGHPEVFRNLAFNAGDLLMIIASICKALYIVISRRVVTRFSPLVITTYSFLICLLACVPFMLTGEALGSLQQVTWKGWMSVIYMGVFSSSAGYLIQQISIKVIGASKTTAFENLVPVFTIIISAVILGESVTAVKVASAAVIMLAVYLNSVYRGGNFNRPHIHRH